MPTTKILMALPPTHEPVRWLLLLLTDHQVWSREALAPWILALAIISRAIRRGIPKWSLAFMGIGGIAATTAMNMVDFTAVSSLLSGILLILGYGIWYAVFLIAMNANAGHTSGTDQFWPAQVKDWFIYSIVFFSAASLILGLYCSNVNVFIALIFTAISIVPILLIVAYGRLGKVARQKSQA